jgi:hypothetical protein
MVGGVQFHPSQRSVIPMRATLITVSVAALLAAGAGPAAAARPESATGRADAAMHARAMRVQGRHYQHLAALTASDAPAQGLRDEQRAAVAASREPAPAPIMRVTRVADGGFDWADAGIGAGLAAALLLSAASVSTLRRQHALATR